MTGTATVRTAAELLGALAERARHIRLAGTIAGIGALTLPPGTTLTGGELRFGGRGLRLTTDNTLADITVVTDEQGIAVHTDPTVDDLGRITLTDVRTVGQVLLTAHGNIRRGHIVADRVMVERADLRGREHRPHGYGVDALPGAFTVWNRQPDPSAVLTGELRGISAGTPTGPVRGSGVFIAGHSDRDGAADGGTVHLTILTTGTVYTDGGITEGTPDLISGGVFVVTGATVDQVVNDAPVTTFGANDMVLDNWGTVHEWITHAAVTSHGPSGIGFVNFGDLEQLDVRAAIQTHGQGARGFNLYGGTLQTALFSDITTHADGAIGIQISRYLPELTVRGNLTTYGARGLSLVKGVQTQLSAIALSVTATGRVDRVTVTGGIHSHGDDTTTVDIQGTVSSLSTATGIAAHGQRSDAVHTARPIPNLNLEGVRSDHGRALVDAGPEHSC